MKTYVDGLWVSASKTVKRMNSCAVFYYLLTLQRDSISV